MVGIFSRRLPSCANCRFYRPESREYGWCYVRRARVPRDFAVVCERKS